MRKKDILIIASVAIVLGALLLMYAFGLQTYLTFENFKAHRVLLKSYVNTHYGATLMLFIVACSSAAFFFLPITGLLALAGGFLFGIPWGIIFAIIGVTTGAVVALALVKTSARHWLERDHGPTLENLASHVQEHGMSYLLFLHFSSLVPLSLIVMVAALARISWQRFIITTSLGFIPMATMFGLAGSQLNTLSSLNQVITWKSLLVLGILAGMCLVSIIIRRMRTIA